MHVHARAHTEDSVNWVHKSTACKSRSGHVDTFFWQDGACPHTVNVVFDFLHDVPGSHALSN
jgi:hypothetical protein